MPSKNNKSNAQSGSTGAGMQVSGEEIFQESDAEVHHVSEEEVQAAFGGQAGSTRGGSTETSSTSGSTAAASSTQSTSSQSTGTQSASDSGQVVGEVLRGNTAPVTEAAKDALNQAKGVAGAVAGQALGQVQEKASSAIESKKQDLTDGLNGVADSIRSLGENLRGSQQQTALAGIAARYSDTVADQVSQLARYFETRDLRDLSRDVQSFARHNPTVFVAGAFVTGLLAARFLKSSPRQALVKRDYYDTDFSSVGNTNSANAASGTASGAASDVRSTSSQSFDLNDPASDTSGTSGTSGTTSGAAGTTTTDPNSNV